MILVIQAIWLIRYLGLWRCRKLNVLQKFERKNLDIQEYPSVDDFEGKKKLHGVQTAWFVAK